VKNAAGDDPKNVSPRVSSSLLDQYLDELLLERRSRTPCPGREGSRRPSGVGTSSPARGSRRALGRRPPEGVRGAPGEVPTARRHPRLAAPVPESRRRGRGAEKAACGNAVARRLPGPQSRAEQRGRRFARSPRSRRPSGRLREGPLDPSSGPDDGHPLRASRLPRLSRRGAARRTGRDLRGGEGALHLALAEERSAKAASDLVAEARGRHPAVVIEEHLPFPYVGRIRGASERPGDAAVPPPPGGRPRDPVPLALAVHSPSLGFGFISDDGKLVLENPQVTSAGPLRALLATDWFDAGDGRRIGYWRPS